MASTVSRFVDFWYSKPPSYVGGTPPQQDWVSVYVKKRDNRGKFILDDNGEPHKFHYHLERSSGDLYGLIDSGDIDSPYEIALKAVGMFCGTIPYAIIVMTFNACKIFVDISSIFWRTVPELIQSISTKGFLAAFGSACMKITWEIPDQVASDLWRIIKTPFYAAAMMTAALFTVASPLEGRKWLGKIEYCWHEGTSFREDLRRTNNCECFGFWEVIHDLKQGKAFYLWKVITELVQGKIIYLGYCMQVRRNINETVAGKKRFEFWKKS